MKEKTFQSSFNKWLKNVHKQTGVFELKIAKGDNLPFDSVVPHQLEALENARWGVLVYKIPDVGYQNPFDTFCVAGISAFIVIKYEKFFCLIDIDTFNLEKERSKRKSLTSERAQDIAWKVINTS